MRTVYFYRLPNGQSPIETFLDSLTGKQAQKVLWVLQIIEELESVPHQYFKKLLRRKLRSLSAIKMNIWQGEKSHE